MKMKNKINTIMPSLSQTTKHDFVYILGLTVLLTAALVLRLINLNYNTPFVDEASSVVIGRLGAFQGDWWTYNAASWMSGLPYINPLLSGLAYITGGIVGSRLLSVILGILTIELIAVITVLISGYQDWRRYLAGLISAAIVAFSPVSFFVSRMSTYDTKSFYFFFLSILLLLWAKISGNKAGKWYFLASLTLALAFMAKIIVAIYVPLVVAFSFLSVRKDKNGMFYWKRYFLLPLVVALAFYGINYSSSVLALAKQQSTKEVYRITDILLRIYEDMPWEWLYGLIGSVGMLLKKEHWKAWLLLVLGALWILTSHIVTQRAIWTMDKHVFVTIAFLSMIAGIGITNMVGFFKNRFIQSVFLVLIILSMSAWSVWGYFDSKKYDTLWVNSGSVSEYMKDNIVKGDKILSEVGTVVMLDIYDKNPPTNTTTFDWFEYNKLSGKDAYIEATKDAYFNFMLLIKDDVPKAESLGQISDAVRENMGEEYKLAYTDDRFEVHKRLY